MSRFAALGESIPSKPPSRFAAFQPDSFFHHEMRQPSFHASANNPFTRSTQDNPFTKSAKKIGVADASAATLAETQILHDAHEKEKTRLRDLEESRQLDNFPALAPPPLAQANLFFPALAAAAVAKNISKQDDVEKNRDGNDAGKKNKTNAAKDTAKDTAKGSDGSDATKDTAKDTTKDATENQRVTSPSLDSVSNHYIVLPPSGVPQLANLDTLRAAHAKKRSPFVRPPKPYVDRIVDLPSQSTEQRVANALVRLHDRRTHRFIEFYGIDAWNKMFKSPFKEPQRGKTSDYLADTIRRMNRDENAVSDGSDTESED